MFHRGIHDASLGRAREKISGKRRKNSGRTKRSRRSNIQVSLDNADAVIEGCPVLRCWKGGVFVRVILTWVWKLKPKAAVHREDDAMALAQALQQKKFPAFVITPCTDKYYRVHVGPYECV